LTGMISKLKFKEQLEMALEKQRRHRHMTEPRARIIRQKAEQLIDLFVELDKRNLLISPSQIDFKRIGNVLKNFDEVNILNTTLLKIYKGRGTRTDVLLKDDNGTRYSISTKQFVVQWGWAYCSLCEVMKTVLTEIIQFPTKPNGIGEVIMALEDKGLDLSFFDFVDPKIRNSFFHLDFCLDGKDIVVFGKREPLSVTDLVESTTRIDAIIYPMIGIIQLFFDRKN
jgi:hypothetical protein